MVEIVVDWRNWRLSEIVWLRINGEKKKILKRRSEEAEADWEQKKLKNGKSHGKIQNRLNFISYFMVMKCYVWFDVNIDIVIID